MKNLKKLIYLLLFLFVLGCHEDEFLNEVPVSILSTKSFFKTSDQFKQSLMSAYSNLRPLVRNSFWVYGELRSDNTTYQNNPKNRGVYTYYDIDVFTIGSSTAGGTDLSQVNWDNSYLGIGKCNVVLKYSEEKEYQKKEQYIGEAKFLRALYYFNLVKWYGDVPLVTKPATSYLEAFEGNKRVSSDLVYDQIIDDLNDAKEKLPENYSSENLGRATEGAARTLLAEVLMWRKQYAEAESELEKVIESNQYSLLDNYSSVFDINNENNEEIIFSVQFIEGTYGLHSDLMYVFTPMNIGPGYLPHAQGTAGGLNIPTENLINSFEKGDLRKTMIDTSFIDHSWGTYHDSIVPFTRKFWDPDHAVQFQTGNNFPLSRYPHVLLMLAECYARTGNGDSDGLVNQVRKRAGLSELDNVTIDDIIHERRVEFHCEADRWGVLVRTEKAIEVMTAHGQEELNNRPKVIRGNAFKNIKILFPIPQLVLENDPSMQQNEEYL
jgi:starch-binding outer membrane protein, SusD/RagB family